MCPFPSFNLNFQRRTAPFLMLALSLSVIAPHLVSALVRVIELLGFVGASGAVGALPESFACGGSAASGSHSELPLESLRRFFCCFDFLPALPRLCVFSLESLPDPFLSEWSLRLLFCV
jgi:hypothetical protein